MIISIEQAAVPVDDIGNLTKAPIVEIPVDAKVDRLVSVDDRVEVTLQGRIVEKSEQGKADYTISLEILAVKVVPNSNEFSALADDSE